MTWALPDGACGAPSELPDLRPIEGPEAEEALAALAKAVALPARVQILRLLARKTARVCSPTVDDLLPARSTDSQRLKILEEAELFRGDFDGPRVCYSLEARALRRFEAPVGGPEERYGSFISPMNDDCGRRASRLRGSR
jgi:ArsR family transcriptional regulator